MFFISSLSLFLLVSIVTEIKKIYNVNNKNRIGLGIKYVNLILGNILLILLMFW